MRLSGAVLAAFFVVIVSVSAWAEEAVKKSIYLVDNMTCGACLATISKGVAGVDGDAVVTGDPARGVVVVYHDAGITAEAVGESITESGYPARVMASVEAGPGEGTPGLPASGGAAGGACCFGGERSACGGPTEGWKALYKAMKERFSPEPATAQSK